MPKDNLSMNPAMAQRKAEKQKQLKKSKAEAQARRNEKLGRRNPDRIQRQIDDIKATEESGQKLRPRDQQLLEALQRDLRAVQKAREALGEQAPKFDAGRGGGGGGRGGGSFRGRGRGDSSRGGVLGKRRRDEHGQFVNDDGDSSSTDEEVRRIPMPRDTPPPIPKEYQRRQGRANNDIGGGAQGPHALPSKPSTAEPPKTVYEAKPEIRNLRQEATKLFVPAAVRTKQDSIRGQGKLLEPEEMDRLEQAGYQAGPGNQPAAGAGDKGEDKGEGDNENEDEVQKRLQEEERRFNQELRSVQIEEVEDEEA
ncbi:WW domain binding protein 11 [Aspergillus candidus]|uniref:WW domain binding protein 11-domain-containing protein n=1 Tax=Aspergillus candidus TaxID=41067 RepID=A0A2I2FEE0_ASPCN|nr:WW domain binding protein 11-domain-containing protein [Aspergillus candidus]PLB39001.1 WW domain binding protein 11-domain-containing protein [Aspergillus candidus]